MKHIRDPVTGRCAVCEANGLDPSALHNGIFYPDTGRSKPPQKPQIIDVREDFRPSPRTEKQLPVYRDERPPNKPASITSQSVTSTASASQVTFATQTSFHDNVTPPPPPTPQARPKKQVPEEPPRYSPEGSPSRARYSDSKFREPQVWFIGDGPDRPIRDEGRVRRSPSPDRRRKQRDRTPSPDDRWRRDRHSYESRSKRSSFNNTKSKPVRRTGTRSSCPGRCRSWCSWRRCCMIFWIIILILLALGALAAAIYFAVAGAENERTVVDQTLLKDPRFLILGYDRPCRTTVITTPTTRVETTTDPNATTTVPPTTDSTTPTTTPILCYEKTTTVIRSGNRFRNAATSTHFRSTFSLTLVVNVIFTLCTFMNLFM